MIDADSSQKPRLIMIYGDSGDTKTTQGYHLARWISQKFNCTGRFIGSNASDAAPYENSGMIQKGTVDYFDISNTKSALAVVRWLSEGYWPRRAKVDGGEVKRVIQKDTRFLTSPDEWKKVGFYVVEGLTGIANLLLNHIRAQEGGVGFKHSFKYEEEGEIIGGLQEGHYGLVQQELYKIIVQGFACLPVKYVIFTALVGKGEDKRTKQSIYGPKGAGDAQTFQIPSWFGDCIHLETMIQQKEDGSGTVEKKIAWFTKHEDWETGIPYLSKIRIMPELYPEILNYEMKAVGGKTIKPFERGYLNLGFKRGLDVLYEVMEKVVERNQQGQETK